MKIDKLKILGVLDVFCCVAHYQYENKDLIALNYSSENLEFIFFKISKKNLFSYIKGLYKIKDLIMNNKNPIYIYKMNTGKDDEFNIIQLSDIKLDLIKEVPKGNDFKTDYNKKLLNQLPAI